MSGRNSVGKRPKGPTTQPYAKEEGFADSLYQPHTVTVGLLGLVLLTYFSFNVSVEDPATSVKWGLACACTAFLFFCAVHLPDGLMLRPHPAFWRLVTGIAILYLMLLVYFAFQPLSTARAIFGFFDSSLNVPLPDRNYAADCRIYTPENPTSSFANVVDTFKDEFILAHVLGHWAKSVMLRNWRLCFMLSVLFELVEITFQHQLENYLECWWDHVIIDILLCNALGCWMGLKTCQFFNAKSYDWVGLKKIKTYRGKAIRLAQQFSPIEWTPYEWGMFTSFKKFSQCIFLVLMVNLVDNNVFFLKFMLWLPPPHIINLLRLAIWWFVAIAALREFYQFTMDKSCRRLGTTAWLALGICYFEVLLIFKWNASDQIFTQPMPSYVFYPWLLSLLLWVIWIVVYFSTLQMKRPLWFDLHLEVLFYTAFLPWVFLFLAGCPDLQWGRQWFENKVVALGLP
eukprot:NODE_1390_length_1524_cov_36.197566_g1315_i0.p1 GENE.NODE_1390_length_1524_cov_36.197566_g1315_i0~~NODE_1390_length_1524_cov_36.197566_g1315_i0.p1  ORF type:complete len:475 (+),score=123.59 NODE_1390_length_1524_cov_36.197566_g1315_i0:58-1425(+)